jgi:hypothetical protein
MLVETLRARWAARGTSARVRVLPEFDGGALTLGAGTQLAEARGDPRNEAAEGERAVALVSAAIGRPLHASAATHVRRALAKAREGDAALALTHLALAGTGRLTEPHEDARRLFIADGLMKAGVPPRTILAALGGAPAQDDLDRAYNPDQPRVPAGNGRPSGQWTNGDWAVNDGTATESHPARPSGAQVADASSTRGHEVASDASPAPTAAPSQEKPSLMQSALAALWAALPSTRYSGLAVEAWRRGDYYQFGLYEAAATLEAGLAIVPGAGAASEALTLAERRALQLAANRLAGKAWEATAQEGLAETGATVFPQVTVETQSGTRYITDFITRDPTTGAIGCVECKASPTASGSNPTLDARV